MPVFFRALTNSPWAGSPQFALVLPWLPFEPEEVDPALEFFSKQKQEQRALDLIRSTRSRTKVAAQIVANGIINRSVERGALSYCAEFGDRADVVVPALLWAFKSGNPERRRVAGSVLEGFGPRAVPALPEMVALRDEDTQVRYGEARILEAMGTNALPAIEALRKATNDLSVDVQRASSRALERLEGISIN